MKVKLFLLITTHFIFHFTVAQNVRNYKSWKVQIDYVKKSPVIEQRFNTDADEIIIKFITSNKPAEKTQAVSLYCKTIDGQWLQANGENSVGDTNICRFKNLSKNDQHVNNREYHLYLPINSRLSWMEVTVPTETYFNPLTACVEQPIVVYNASFLPGATTTSPGLYWTNILSRKLERPVLNIDFSRNKRLENKHVELIIGNDAKIFVLDFAGDFVQRDNSISEIKNSISKAVTLLRKKMPGTPVLLSGYYNDAHQKINSTSQRSFTLAAKAIKEVYDSLIAAGVKNIYLLSRKVRDKYSLSIATNVAAGERDMMQCANAYEQKIRTILNEQVGTINTTIPVMQRRDAASYDWETRHSGVLALNKKMKPQVVFIGNSITHYWGGKPAAPYARGTASWDKYFEPRQAINLGFGWDRIENVLWRVHHDELDNITPRHIVIMIGTNNLEHNTDNEIIEGLQFLMKAIQFKQPTATILLMGILPRRAMENRISKLNKMIAESITGANIKYADAGTLLLSEENTIDESLFSDGLHLNATGYEKLGSFIEEQLIKSD